VTHGILEKQLFIKIENFQIKFMPQHRKIKFLLKEIDKDPATVVSNRLHGCELFVCAAITQELLFSEFKSPRHQQNTANLNLYINLIIDLAQQERLIDRKLEKIFLSATDMDVSSDYYYLAANLLRLKVSVSVE
jgi:hypothetical protein